MWARQLAPEGRTVVTTTSAAIDAARRLTPSRLGI
jgi:hypothetical protein